MATKLLKFPGLMAGASGLALVGLTMTAPPAGAQDAYSILQECQKIEADAKRLECYDQGAAKAVAEGPAPAQQITSAPSTVSPTAPTAAVAVATPEVAPAPDSRETFGLRKTDEEIKKSSITVLVTNASKSKRGKWIFRTEDGQVWMQTDNKKFYLPGSTFQATISAALVSGHYFKAEGVKRRIRVKRLK